MTKYRFTGGNSNTVDLNKEKINFRLHGRPLDPNSDLLIPIKIYGQLSDIKVNPDYRAIRDELIPKLIEKQVQKQVLDKYIPPAKEGGESSIERKVLEGILGL